MSSIPATVIHQQNRPKPPPAADPKFILTWKCLQDDSIQPSPKSVPIAQAGNKNTNQQLNPTNQEISTLKPINNWMCLQNDSIQPKSAKEPTNNSTNPSKSFAQALTNIWDTLQRQLPKPDLKGDELEIQIPEDEYMDGLTACKHNLHGRIIWPKGTTPLTVVALRNKLAPLWKSLSRWGISSIGKGYYEMAFSSIEDMKRVRSTTSWNLNPGVLKHFAWTKDFNPSVQKLSSA